MLLLGTNRVHGHRRGSGCGQNSAPSVWITGSPFGLLESSTQEIIVGKEDHARGVGGPLIAHWRQGAMGFRHLFPLIEQTHIKAFVPNIRIVLVHFLVVSYN